MSPPRLPEQVRLRRIELGLSVRKAARLAEVHRETWTMWEAGQKQPMSGSYGGIERALQWKPGSMDAILAGGEATPVEQPPPPDHHDPLTGEEYEDPVEQKLWALRDALGQRWVDQYGPERAAEMGAERAREHIRLHRLRLAMEAPEVKPAQVA